MLFAVTIALAIAETFYIVACCILRAQILGEAYDWI
jgi:hypothetical protein